MFNKIFGREENRVEKAKKLFYQAWNKEQKGNYEQAIILYTKTIKHNPKHLNA